MKIARYRKENQTLWGIVAPDMQTVRAIVGEAFAEWAPRITAGARIDTLKLGEPCPLAAVKLLPPIERGNQVVVIGANYSRHLEELRIEVPKVPIPFLKSFGAIIGATDDLVHPSVTEKLDFEVELVAVIGAPIAADANGLTGVLGYTVGNDVSGRDLQPGTPGIGMDLFSAKSLDGTTGLGPWIVTRDEIPGDRPDLAMTLTVNGEIRQNARTSEMSWNPRQLVELINARARFHPGDVVFTGTPPGVAWHDGRYLRRGDVMEATIEHIGTIRNRIV